MPLVHATASVRSRCEDDDDGRAAMSTRSSSMSRVKKPQSAKETKAQNHTYEADDGDDDDSGGSGAIAPMSPRVRKRLDDAKENASLFNPVCSQGEVIQWMSACHPELIEFGRSLERRGYDTLSSIAFLTEDDIDCAIDASIKQLLLATLSRLRHEFFRM